MVAVKAKRTPWLYFLFWPSGLAVFSLLRDVDSAYSDGKRVLSGRLFAAPSLKLSYPQRGPRAED